MTSSEVNYNADASSHFSWSHPYFSFSMTPSSSEVNYNVNERDFFHFYKQVQIPTSVFIKNNNNNNNNNNKKSYINDQSRELFFIREISQDGIC